jgi:hypothetical protein
MAIRLPQNRLWRFALSIHGHSQRERSRLDDERVWEEMEELLEREIQLPEPEG